MAGAQVADAGNALLDAERQGSVMAVTIAAAGSAPTGQSTVTVAQALAELGLETTRSSISVDVAASVSLNSLGGETQAFIENAAVQGTGAVSLTANDSSTIDADGGGAAIASDLTGGKRRRPCHRRGGFGRGQRRDHDGGGLSRQCAGGPRCPGRHHGREQFDDRCRDRGRSGGVQQHHRMSAWHSAAPARDRAITSRTRFRHMWKTAPACSPKACRLPPSTIHRSARRPSPLR